MTGFEPVTFCTQNKRATKLRYIPFSIVVQCHCTKALSCFPHRYFLLYLYKKNSCHFFFLVSYTYNKLYTSETKPKIKKECLFNRHFSYKCKNTSDPQFSSSI